MAEIRYRVCDRCGKRIDYTKGWLSRIFGACKEHGKIKIHKVYNGNTSGYDYADYNLELCEKCTSELTEFLKKPQLEEMEK